MALLQPELEAAIAILDRFEEGTPTRHPHPNINILKEKWVKDFRVKSCADFQGHAQAVIENNKRQND